MKLWDFIKSSALYLSVHMERSLRLSFTSNVASGVHGGHHHGIPIQDRGGFSPASRRIPQKFPQYHMSTCSIHHRVTGSGHPLNEGLRGYYQGNVPWVL
jgi:hypothetical protein